MEDLGDSRRVDTKHSPVSQKEWWGCELEASAGFASAPTWVIAISLCQPMSFSKFLFQQTPFWFLRLNSFGSRTHRRSPNSLFHAFDGGMASSLTQTAAASNHYASGTGGHPGKSFMKTLPTYPRYSMPISLVKKPSAVNLRSSEKNSIPCPRLGSILTFLL